MTIQDTRAGSFVELAGPELTFVFFHDQWSDTSNAMMPAVEALAAEFGGRLRFVRASFYDFWGLMAEQRVYRAPASLIARRSPASGEPLIAQALFGACSHEQLRRMIAQALDSAGA